jgi:hypothetical protein
MHLNKQTPPMAGFGEFIGKQDLAEVHFFLVAEVKK